MVPTATKDLRVAAAYIRRDFPAAARRWYKQIKARIATLKYLPERCRIAPEGEHFGEPIRELLYGSGNRGTYRVLFYIVETRVDVIHVRHGSMLPLSTPDDN